MFTLGTVTNSNFFQEIDIDTDIDILFTFHKSTIKQ